MRENQGGTFDYYSQYFETTFCHIWFILGVRNGRRSPFIYYIFLQSENVTEKLRFGKFENSVQSEIVKFHMNLL